MFVVNGKEVEYLHIKENVDGDIIVEYDEHFNIVNAHMSIIMKRLKDNNLKCYVFKDFKHGIIVLFLYRLEDLHSVLHVLNVPFGCYEVNEEDLLVTIDVGVLDGLM